MLHTAMFMAAVTLCHAPDTVVAPREQHLGEAKVTALRSAASQSSVPVQRVSAADIERRGMTSLAEALHTFAGVSVKDYGGVGGLKTVSIRSFGAQHTGVCYDGIVQADVMNGQVDIGRFHLDDVQSIRLDVAGSDDIFRPAKLASYVGVVNVETSSVQDDRSENQEVKCSMRYGSFETYNPYVSHRQPIGKTWRVGVWGNYLHSAGDYPFRLRNGALVTDEVRLGSQVSQGGGEAYATGQLGRYGTLRLKAGTFVSSRGLPGSVILYTQHPTEHLWDRNASASALYTGGVGQWKFRASLAYARLYNRYTDNDVKYLVPEDDRYTQQMGSLSATALWQALPTLSFSLAEDIDVAHLESNLPESVKPTRNTSNTALSAKFATSRLTAVGTLLGLLRWEEREVAPGFPPMPSSVDSRLSPTVSVSYKVLAYNPLTHSGTDLRLRASYKESYRLPSFTDLYYLRVGNRYLEPECAEQFNLGVTWQHDFGRASAARRQHHLAFTADAYYNHVRDKIVAIPTMFIWHMRNVGRVEMKGLDVTASYHAALTSWLALHADVGYSFQHAIDVTDAAAKNYRHQIAYTPRHSGSAVISTVFPWFTASYTLVAVGERYSLAQNTAAYRIEPYCDHSVSLNRSFAFPRFRLHISAEALNLGGRNYEIVKYYPMPGRQWRVTLRLNF